MSQKHCDAASEIVIHEEKKRGFDYCLIGSGTGEALKFCACGASLNLFCEDLTISIHRDTCRFRATFTMVLYLLVALALVFSVSLWKICGYGMDVNMV